MLSDGVSLGAIRPTQSPVAVRFLVLNERVRKVGIIEQPISKVPRKEVEATHSDLWTKDARVKMNRTFWERTASLH